LQQGLKTLNINYKTIKHVDDNIYVVIFDSRQQAEDAVECSVVGSGGGVHLRPLSRSSHELKCKLMLTGAVDQRKAGISTCAAKRMIHGHLGGQFSRALKAMQPRKEKGATASKP